MSGATICPIDVMRNPASSVQRGSQTALASPHHAFSVRNAFRVCPPRRGSKTAGTRHPPSHHRCSDFIEAARCAAVFQGRREHPKARRFLELGACRRSADTRTPRTSAPVRGRRPRHLADADAGCRQLCAADTAPAGAGGIHARTTRGAESRHTRSRCPQDVRAMSCGAERGR